MGVCKGFSQCILVVINILFSLIGILLLVIGAVVRWGDDFMNSILEDAYSKLSTALRDANVSDSLSDFNIGEFVGNATIAFVVIGAFFFVIGILGCIGACCKVRCMLILYIVCLVLILLAELTLIILVFAVSDEVDKWVKKPFQTAIDEDYTGIGGKDSITLAINFVSTEFECCGVEGYTDFSNATKWNRTIEGTSQLKQIPTVCCKNKTDTQCVLQPNSNNSYFETGCYEEIKDWINDNKNILIGSSAGVLAVEILLMIFACVVCIRDKKKDDYERHA